MKITSSPGMYLLVFVCGIQLIITDHRYKKRPFWSHESICKIWLATRSSLTLTYVAEGHERSVPPNAGQEGEWCRGFGGAETPNSLTRPTSLELHGTPHCACLTIPHSPKGRRGMVPRLWRSGDAKFPDSSHFARASRDTPLRVSHNPA